MTLTIARAAEAIVAATVVSVSGENIESAIPSYRVQLIVHDHIMPTELAKTAMLSMDVIGAPDSDCPGSDPVPVIGDVVIAFLEERQLGDTIAVQPVAGVGSMLWVGQDGLLRPYADGAGDKLEAQTLDAVMDQINGARGQDSRQ